MTTPTPKPAPIGKRAWWDAFLGVALLIWLIVAIAGRHWPEATTVMLLTIGYQLDRILRVLKA